MDSNAFQKFAKKILRFANSIFRITLPGLAPLSGLRAHLPVPATFEAAPQGFQGPGSQAPICRFLRRTDIAKIRLSIEGSLEFLSVDLSILVQNVSIDTGYHVDLGMACIALGGFQIAVVQFQFVSGTGMTERMKEIGRASCRERV